jgi:RHS repeat-associated protein
VHLRRGENRTASGGSLETAGRQTHQGFGGDAAAAQWTVVSSVDPAGRRTSINTPPFGTAPATTIQTSFDLLGLPTCVIDEHGTSPDETIASFGYIGFDRLLEQTRGDGTTWQAHDGSSDFFDFATRRTGARITHGAGSVLFEEQIRYDQRNEVRAVIWSHGRAGNDSEAQTYAFDELGRLIDFKQGLWDPTAQGGVGAIASGDPNLTASRTWQLDVLGNWRAHDPSGDGQGPLQPQLDAVNAYTHFPTMVDTDGNGSPDTLQQLPLTYDEARGFLFERVEQLSGTSPVKTVEYQHDLLGRMVQVTRRTSGNPEVLAQYGYLADGRLAWRCPGVCDGGGGPRRWLVYDGNQPVHEGTGAAGVAPEWSYVWLGSTLLKATGSSAGERFVHQDRLGSVVMETRSSAGAVQVLGRASYDPYGRPTPIPSWSGASLQVPYGYAGARREDAAGLYLMGARWYDPTLGRFIEQDPIGELGGVNLYAYTGSSPISWTDPSGLYTKGGKNRLAYGKPTEPVYQSKGGGGPGGIPNSRRTGPGADNTRYTVDGVSINDPVSGQASPRSVGAYLRMSADPRAEWKQAREQAANWGRSKADETTTGTASVGGLRFRYSEGDVASGGVSAAPYSGSESTPEDIGAEETVDVLGELSMGPGWGTFIKLGVDFGTDFIPGVSNLKSLWRCGVNVYNGEYLAAGGEPLGVGLGPPAKGAKWAYRFAKHGDEIVDVARVLKGSRVATGTRAIDVGLDATGKVHGKLPDVEDLGQYEIDELAGLLDDLTQSVQKRIEVIVEKGSDFGHGDRLAAEQQLIKSIEKHLNDR